MKPFLKVKIYSSHILLVLLCGVFWFKNLGKQEENTEVLGLGLRHLFRVVRVSYYLY